MNISVSYFKRIVIYFWAFWWLIAFLTDLLGGIKHIGWLNAGWISDQNYPFLVKSLQMYHVPTWLPALFFILIILWSLASTLLFFQAALSQKWATTAKNAFIVSLTLWLVFFMADQIIMNFDLEANHMIQGSFELLTFLMMYIVRD